MYKVTLSMPIYNVEKYVERALLSALNQTFESIEYLIVDDQGMDNSMDIVRKIIATHPRGKDVRIIEHKVNIGLGAGRNTAIDTAQGEYLYFMDSDDEITPDCISILYENMRETKCELVCASHKMITNIETVVSNEDRFIQNDKEQIVLSYFNNKFPIQVWNKLYQLSFLRENQIRCRPHQTIEDNYFSFQVLLNIQSYSVVPEITYNYYIRTTSVTGIRWNEKVFLQWTQILGDLLDVLQKSSIHSQLKIQIKRKLFLRRLGIAQLALASQYPVQHYINDYLSPVFLKDKDTFRDSYLFLAYIFSCMPFLIKKICLLIYMKTMKKI